MPADKRKEMPSPQTDIAAVIKQRRAMFKMGRMYQDSALSIAEDVSVPDFREELKITGQRSVHLLLHAVALASLQIPQFRLRIRSHRSKSASKADTTADEEIVAVGSDELHCNYVVKNPYTDINHCSVPFDADFAVFAAQAQRQELVATQAKDILKPSPDPDGINAVNFSVIPWLRLNSLVHGSVGPIPMFTIGRFIPTSDNQIKFTLCTLVNHRLVDAFHVAQLIEQFRTNVKTALVSTVE